MNKRNRAVMRAMAECIDLQSERIAELEGRRVDYVAYPVGAWDQDLINAVALPRRLNTIKHHLDNQHYTVAALLLDALLFSLREFIKDEFNAKGVDSNC